MNSYITLDGNKYNCLHGRWAKQSNKPSRERQTLSGGVDVTYGPGTFTIWEGDVRVYVTPAGGYGDPANLEASYAKTETMVFVDFDGVDYNVHFLGILTPTSLSPMWDAATNTFTYKIRLVKESEVA